MARRSARARAATHRTASVPDPGAGSDMAAAAAPCMCSARVGAASTCTAMLRVITFFFISLEAQKCLSRLLGTRPPVVERDLDALEEKVLAEVGLCLRREYQGACSSSHAPPAGSDELSYERIRSLRNSWRRGTSSEQANTEVVTARRVTLARWEQSGPTAATRCAAVASTSTERLERKLNFDDIPVEQAESGALQVIDPILRRCPSLSSVSSEALPEWSSEMSVSRLKAPLSVDDYLSPLTDVADSESFERTPMSSVSSDTSSQVPESGNRSPAAALPFVHVLVAGNEQDMFSGTNPQLRPLLLIHGHSMSSAYFRHVLADFAATGRYVVYAIDMLGWGRSSRPPYTTGRAPRDTAARAQVAVHFMIRGISEFLYSSGIESWCRKNGKRIDIVAHSLGAYVASRYTVEASNGLVQNLVLVTPAGIWSKQSYKRAVYFQLTPQMIMRNAGVLGYLAFRLRWPGRDLGFRSRYLRRYTYALATRRGGQSADLAFAALVTVSHKKRTARCVHPLASDGETTGGSILEQLPCCVNGRIRIVAGATDSLISVHELERAYQVMDKAAPREHQVSFRVIPACGHVPFLEHPEQFLEACGLCDS